MTALTSAQIDLIKKMNVQRIQTDDTEFFTPSESVTLNELITLDLVQKVRGRLGWSAWQVVNFYDLMDSIDTPATFTATCECGELLIDDADECAACADVQAQTVSASDATLSAAQIAFIESLAQADELAVRVWDADFIAGGGVDLAARGLIFDEAIAAFGFHEVHVTCDAIEAATLAQAARALPFDGPIEDTDYPAPVDPRDARIAELEAQVKALQSQIGLLPANVYKAYLDTQDARLSRVPYAMACMGLKDAVRRAIFFCPTGFPIVQEAK
jgi:hypothetical protein